MKETMNEVIKKWWFWLIFGLVVLAIFTPTPTDDNKSKELQLKLDNSIEKFEEVCNLQNKEADLMNQAADIINMYQLEIGQEETYFTEQIELDCQTLGKELK